MLGTDLIKSLFETETPGEQKMREQNDRVKRLRDEERLGGGGDCGAEPGRGQVPQGEDELIIRKEKRFACFPSANTRVSRGREDTS